MDRTQKNGPQAARDFGLRATLTASTSRRILRLIYSECPAVQFITSERRALTEPITHKRLRCD